jgi:ribosomal protein L37AE/L43A
MTNEKDSKFCDGCGKPLSGNCPSCQGANRPGAKFCQHCGQRLGGTASAAVVAAPAPVAPQINRAAATKTFTLVLLSKEGRELARFPLREGVNQVGAKSTGEGILPEVDLSVLDTEQVISRRHAVIRVTSERVMLADCGSTNGTRVDGTKIGTVEVSVDERSNILFGNLHTRLVRN